MSYTVFEAQRIAAEREKTDRLRAARLAAEATKAAEAPVRKARPPRPAQVQIQRHRPGKFDDLVDRSAGEFKCHPWLSSIMHGGTPTYGTENDGASHEDSRLISARRYYFKRVTGAELTDDLVISNTCELDGCMNPRHWRVGPILGGRKSCNHPQAVDFNNYIEAFRCIAS